MSQPLVSLITTAYRSRPEHLRTAIRSALTQTWERLELLVSDDSPTDSLAAVVDTFGDTRVRYRHNTPALGVARNHWKCLQEVSGPYVAILNHDDCLEPDFLARLIEPLDRDSGLALAFCDHWVVDDEGRRLPDETTATSAKWGRAALGPGVHRPFFDLFAAQTIPMAMGTVFRRELLPAVLPDVAGPAYDLWLTYLLCRAGWGAYYVTDRLSSWRAHPTNLTSQAGVDWAFGSAECWRAVLDDERLQSIWRTARQKGALAAYACATHSWQEGARLACWHFAAQSLRMQPSWRGFAACCLPLLPRSLWARSRELSCSQRRQCDERLGMRHEH